MAQKTTLTEALGADATGDWHKLTVKELNLAVYDTTDDFASGVVVEFDLCDDPLTVAVPVNFAPIYDEAGLKVQVTEKRSDMVLTFVADENRIRTRTVGGDGNTKILSRVSH